MSRSKLTINVPYKIVAMFGPSPVGDNGKDEVRYLCPECISRKGTPDKSGHLYVNTKTFKYHCHRCGYGGTIGRHLVVGDERYYEEDRNYEIEQLIDDIGQVVSSDSEFPLIIPSDKVTVSSSATNYLLSRGFTYDQMEYYDLRVGNLDKEFGRIIIPNRVSRKVYADTYSARTYIGQEPKYHNPVDIKKTGIVFNLHRIEEGTPIILVEGALTAIAAGYHAVASLGKTLSRDQASQIAAKHPSIIYVNYDYGAEKNSRDACQLLSTYCPDIPIFEVKMKDDRDAADLSHEEYSLCLKSATRYVPLFEDIVNFVESSDINEVRNKMRST